ncbi:MAG: 16S rRNA (guanine(527)-N(7))-methyltransferase RsmG [Fibromonadaceae bacterium]|jgi:16S rRNA (guanine527-N7)-methyltransferase|nr:16S rRNA (guanine(527)-N(7))-methyltransferase RsmG [Fibromonadaceae bacterium]
MNNVKPSVQGLDTLLRWHGIELNKETLKKLWLFHGLLREHNKDQDLTRLNAFKTIVERHYADCIIINSFVKKWPSKMLDIGSGAGFPGIPLKLVNPNIHLILCEPRPRRAAFLSLAIKELALQGIEVFAHKVTSNSMSEPVEGIICRAFASISETLPRLSNCLKKGGKAYFMKGPAVKEELMQFTNIQYALKETHYYNIPNSPQKRSLVVLERL